MVESSSTPLNSEFWAVLLTPLEALAPIQVEFIRYSEPDFDKVWYVKKCTDTNEEFHISVSNLFATYDEALMYAAVRFSSLLDEFERKFTLIDPKIVKKMVKYSNELLVDYGNKMPDRLLIYKLQFDT